MSKIINYKNVSINLVDPKEGSDNNFSLYKKIILKKFI